MAKAKEKHEKDTNEAVKAENRRCNEKIEASESRIQKLAAIIHRQNEERLQLWKDYEILKTKLRSANINFQLNGNAASNMFEGKKTKGAQNFGCLQISSNHDKYYNNNNYSRQVVHLKWKTKRANYLTTLTWMN